MRGDNLTDRMPDHHIRPHTHDSTNRNNANSTANNAACVNTV
ncbi:hypothetical protein NKH77_33935 [Streptomyces sp. M19]